MAAWLEDLDTGERWTLSRGVDNVIGREPAAHIRLIVNCVSRRHSHIRHTDRGWEVTDSGSTGGTWIKLGGATASKIIFHVLRRGDVFVYGNRHLRFDENDAPREAADGMNTMQAERKNTRS